jgi:hypothetical protein
VKTSIVLRAGAAVLTMTTGPIAMAEASLTLTPTGSRCVTIRSDPTGTTSTSDSCTPSASSPFSVFSAVGTSGSSLSFIELQYQFSYRDDGLTLPAPVILDTADYVGVGGTVSGLPPRVTFESATLAVDVTSTFGPNPAGPGYAISAFVGSNAPADSVRVVDGYMMFGLNNRADNFSGMITLQVGVTAFAFSDLATVTGLSVTPAVAAIPEPSTFALLIGGLVPVMLWHRRRQPGTRV